MRRLLRGALLALVVGLTGVPLAHAVRAPGEHVDAELVAERDGISPGGTITIGLRLRHDPKWHTYWQVAGDSGLPTRVAWSLPSGFTTGALQWPAPQRLPYGPLVNYGYDGEVVLLADLQAPADIAPGTSVQLAARADWLVCSDICIPGGADLTLTLPVRAADALQPTRATAVIAANRMRVPQPRPLEALAAVRQDTRIALDFRPPDGRAPAALAFFPLEDARIEPAAEQALGRSVDGRGVALRLEAAAPVAADFARLRGVLVADGGPGAAGGWAATVDVPLPAGVVAALPAGGTGGATASARGPGGAADAARGPGGGAAGSTAVGGSGVASIGVGAALAGAFIGGLILNLMPCVFPVLSLKLLGLLAHRRREDEPLARHGLAFTAGVLLSFLALAGALIALQAAGQRLGWGFQLQSPAVVAGLVALFFLIGVNLLGAFEFTLGTGLANLGMAGGDDRVRPDSAAGSFATGILAVVVAAPCTAPFMGAAMGFAATQPPAMALTVFAALALGMATPYLLLTLFPRLLARLPRPGAWMERFRQAMAFPMFATCIWLLWVLGQQVDIHVLAQVLAGLLVLALAAWAFGLHQRGVRGWRWVAGAALAAGVYVVVGALAAGDAERGGGAGGAAAATVPGTGAAAAPAAAWGEWSPERVRELASAGTPVFVDFTAAWCVTCQVNKRMVLQRATVTEAFAARGVVRLRADWTQRDDRITAELARFGRNGVPVYVLFDAAGRPKLLPEVLTERVVLDALGTLTPAS